MSWGTDKIFQPIFGRSSSSWKSCENTIFVLILFVYSFRELFKVSNATLEQEFGQLLAELGPGKAMILVMMYGHPKNDVRTAENQ